MTLLRDYLFKDNSGDFKHDRKKKDINEAKRNSQ